MCCSNKIWPPSSHLNSLSTYSNRILDGSRKKKRKIQSICYSLDECVGKWIQRPLSSQRKRKRFSFFWNKIKLSIYIISIHSFQSSYFLLSLIFHWFFKFKLFKLDRIAFDGGKNWPFFECAGVFQRTNSHVKSCPFHQSSHLNVTLFSQRHLMRRMVMDSSTTGCKQKKRDSILANKMNSPQISNVFVCCCYRIGCIIKYVYLMGFILSLHFRNDCKSMQFRLLYRPSHISVFHLKIARHKNQTVKSHYKTRFGCVVLCYEYFYASPKRTTIHFRFSFASQFYCG